jgi:hypothetical protein
MGKQISAPLTERFRLDKYDPDPGDTFVAIKQARQAEQETHDNLFSETTRIWNDRNAPGGEMRLMQRVSVGEVIRTEAFLTLIDCNILGLDGQALFKFGQRPNGSTGVTMEPEAFKVAWGQLDAKVVEEIHEKIRKMNPQWGPEGKAG